MRAPLSQLAKEVISDPIAVKALKDWVDSGQGVGKITRSLPNGSQQTIQVKRVNKPEATHGFEKRKVPFLNTIHQSIASFLDMILNP